MYLLKVISRKLGEKKISFYVGALKVMTKIAGSGSISQRHGSGDPDPDPHQNGSATLVLLQQKYVENY